MRLTMFSRLLIVLVVMLGVFFGVKYFLDQRDGTGVPDQTEVTGTTEQDAQAEAPANATPADVAAQPGFNFTPPAPEGGTLKGVVELGASGFNSFIVRTDEQDRWDLQKAEFGTSLVHENMASAADIREGLKKYIGNMLNYGVAGRDIHFVTSSGAAKSESVEQISTQLKTLGYVVNGVSAEREGQLAFRATMPEAYQEDAYVVDIGSSNTKISWMENGQIRSLETYGSKYFQNGTSDEKVFQEVKQIASRIPQDRRLVAFYIGGTPFDLAKTHRQGEERYTVLRAPDQYETEEQKTRAGLNIIRAIREATGTETMVFDWDSNFTIGFLLTL